MLEYFDTDAPTEKCFSCGEDTSAGVRVSNVLLPLANVCLCEGCAEEVVNILEKELGERT